MVTLNDFRMNVLIDERKWLRVALGSLSLGQVFPECPKGCKYLASKENGGRTNMVVLPEGVGIRDVTVPKGAEILARQEGEVRFEYSGRRYVIKSGGER